MKQTTQSQDRVLDSAILLAIAASLEHDGDIVKCFQQCNLGYQLYFLEECKLIGPFDIVTMLEALPRITFEQSQAFIEHINQRLGW